MGLVRAKIILRNPRDGHLKPFETEALVDTGSLHLCVPEHVALQLRMEELEKREFTTADGKRRLCSYVGPVEVRFENRACYTGALVLGDEVLLGVVPMEDMDLVVSPSLRTITVNPQSPNIPSSVVKPVRSPPALRVSPAPPTVSPRPVRSRRAATPGRARTRRRSVGR